MGSQLSSKTKLSDDGERNLQMKLVRVAILWSPLFKLAVVDRRLGGVVGALDRKDTCPNRLDGNCDVVRRARDAVEPAERFRGWGRG